MVKKQPPISRPSVAPLRAILAGGSRGETSRLRQLLESVREIRVVGAAASAAEAADLAESSPADVVLLDADAADFNGPALVPAAVPVMVVVLGDDAATAAQAFRSGAVDFLLRPLTPAGLTILASRLVSMRSRPRGFSPAAEVGLGGRAEAEPVGEAEPLTTAASRTAALTIDDKVAVSLERGKSVDLVPVTAIVWIESLQNYTRLQLADRKPVVIKRTLSEWEAMLPSGHFGRIGRSIIIQLTRLRSSVWQSRDETLLEFEGCTDRLTVGRSAASRLKELLRGTGSR